MPEPPASIEPEPQRSADAASATRSVGVVGLAVMSSRLLGLVRELIFASLFGAGRNLDAFLVAFRTPNLLRDLFAEGALSAAFVTTFSKKIATEGDGPAWKLANKVATLTAVALSGITLAGVLAAPLIVAIIAPWFDAEKAALTTSLVRIMYPFIVMVSLAALVMGMLNAKHVFGIPAMASTFFNIGSIVAGVGIGWWLDPSFGPRALTGLAIGTLVGGLLQLAIQFPSLAKVGYRFRPDFAWNDPGVRHVLSLMGPAIVAASAVQVNVLINTIFASSLQDGAVSWLNIAFRLMQLPLGIFGVAIATVTLPLISKSAAMGNVDEFRSTLARGTRLAFALTIPSAIGLALLARPIISLIYERGRFTPEMTENTAGALQFYAIGLVAYSALKVITPAFYAIEKKNTPMIIGFVAIGTNLILNWIFTFQLGLGHRGLALSTGLVATINFIALYTLMRHHLKGMETAHLMGALARLCVAGAGLVGVCLAADRWWLAGWGAFGLAQRSLRLFSTIGVAAAVFFAIAALLRVQEVGEVAQILSMRFVRRRKSRILTANERQ
jgi:putative peptidoglycan lipid II flippase